MSHYLITKLRVGQGGRITDVAMQRLEAARAVVGLGLGPEEWLPSAQAIDRLAHGDVAYIGRHADDGACVIGDEVRVAPRGEGLESCNVDGARTDALRRLPQAA